MNRTFDQWWFHGYFNYPPPPDEIMQLPDGGTKTVELACNKVRCLQRDIFHDAKTKKFKLIPQAFTSYWNQVASEPYQTNDPCRTSSIHSALVPCSEQGYLSRAIAWCIAHHWHQ